MVDKLLVTGAELRQTVRSWLALGCSVPPARMRGPVSEHGRLPHGALECLLRRTMWATSTRIEPLALTVRAA